MQEYSWTDEGGGGLGNFLFYEPLFSKTTLPDPVRYENVVLICGQDRVNGGGGTKTMKCVI